MSYAFNAVIEAAYAIEYNTNNKVDLSDAYLYMGAFSTHIFNYKSLLEDEFKIPMANQSGGAYLYNKFIPNVDDWFSSKYNGYKYQADKCLAEGRDFRLKEVGAAGSYQVDNQCGSHLTRRTYVTVENVIDIYPYYLHSSTHLKNMIISNGPLVMKVTNTNNLLNKFGSYGSSQAQVPEHVYALIGWEDAGHSTKWILKDSWPGHSGIIKTDPSKLSDRYLIDLIWSGDVKLARVENVVKNNNPPYSGQKFQVNESLQCVLELSTLTIDVNDIRIDNRWYSKAFISSNVAVDEWEWRFDFSRLTRSRNDGETETSIYVSAIKSGMSTFKVRAKLNGKWTAWKTKSVYLDTIGRIR